jgi:hypothetical protein
LDLKRHGGRTGAGVTVRVLQRILALTAVNWHNDKTGQPTLRSLVTDPFVLPRSRRRPRGVLTHAKAMMQPTVHRPISVLPCARAPE